jgi:hypothetical protein
MTRPFELVADPRGGLLACMRVAARCAHRGLRRGRSPGQLAADHRAGVRLVRRSRTSTRAKHA